MPKENAALALTNRMSGDGVGSGKSIAVDSSRPVDIICVRLVVGECT